MIAYLFMAILGLGAVVSIQEARPLEPFLERTTFAFNEGKATLPADTLKLISFGYERLFSNLLWLRFLQHTPVDKVPAGQISWIYHDLDTITSLDSEFYPGFEHGGVFLSVITEDKVGAERLMVKGTKAMPERWRIHAYLAYHYQHELDEEEKAYEQYAAAAKLPGAPAFLGIYAARHVARTESIQASIAFLRVLKESTEDERMKKNFQNRIEMWTKKLHEAEKKNE